MRTAIPVLPTARRRATRLALAIPFFATVLVAAISCAENGVIEPFVPSSPVAGLKSSYDSVAPMAEKLAPLASAGRIGSLSPLSSVSGSAAALSSVSSIAFAPEPGPFANELPACDDCVFGGTTGFPIGFDFKYYGSTYKTFWVSTNGFISFQRPPHHGCCHGANIPVFDNINNMIALAWVDLVPQGGQMSFETRGEAPNRRFIFNLSNVLMFNEGGRRVTAQVILYERTNNVELHTTSQPFVQAHRVTQGAENQAGTEAAFVAGRVASTTYTVSNDAVRYTGEASNAVPVAIPGGNAGNPVNRYEGVEGAAIQFKGSGTDADGDQLTYSWDFNNDGLADAETAEASHSWPDNGTYRATLFVSDGHGGIGQASVDVIVKNVAPSAEAGEDVRIIAGQTVNFSGQFSDAGVNDAPWGWTWNLGSQGNYYGTTRDQSAAVLGSHRFCRAGSFEARFTVVDKDGGSGSDALVVTVDPQSIDIDISPSHIVLNDNGNALIRVRIFSRPDFDATAMNPSSVKLTNGSGRGTSIARTGGGLWMWDTSGDLNGDGLLDAIAYFRRDELLQNNDLAIATTQLYLKGDVGDCGEVLGIVPVRVQVLGKPATAGSSLQPPRNP